METAFSGARSFSRGKEAGEQFSGPLYKAPTVRARTEFEQIFYMDADTLAYRAFPEIWSFPVASAASRDVRK